MKSKTTANQPNVGAGVNDVGANDNGTAQAYSPASDANGSAPHAYQSPPTPARLLPTLPTFPLDYGWRAVYDEETNHTYHIPLTLRDVLFPTEDDVEAVFMSQGPTHNSLITLIAELLRLYLGSQGWYFPNDVLIRWGIPGVTDKSPDIALIPNARVPSDDKKSYMVGRDGPLPKAVIEITSESTREEDFIGKRNLYAAAGVEEYLIIDLCEDAEKPWQLHGYRLGESPYYDSLTPGDDGSITLQTVGLRFVPIGRTRIDIFDSQTNQRLRNAVEYMDTAEQEAARADAAEATVEALMKRLQELEEGNNQE